MAALNAGLDFVRECSENMLKLGGSRIDPSKLPSIAGATSTVPCDLSIAERHALICSIGEEVIGEDELDALLSRTSVRPIAYDGFEPSGRMHIAQGVLKALNVNKLTRAGCDFVFWIADYFAQLNNKMGGDLRKIRIVGRYFIEVWKACGMRGIGGTESGDAAAAAGQGQVSFVWCADSINQNADTYWPLVLDIARSATIARVSRCSGIMGRAEGAEQPASSIIYPVMQAADIFHLRASITQLGMDQRKVNMLAREYAADRGLPPPIVVSHHMLMGLDGSTKMSKSSPDSAIFMEDSAAEVDRKIKAAFCEPQSTSATNPILDYCENLVMPALGALTVSLRAGARTFATYPELAAAFAAGDVHPGELKPAVAAAINALIEPVRVHFATNAEAADLLRQVQSFRVTK